MGQALLRGIRKRFGGSKVIRGIDLEVRDRDFLVKHLGDSSTIHPRVDGVAELLSAKVGAANDRLETGQGVGLAPDAAWPLNFDADQQLLAAA